MASAQFDQSKSSPEKLRLRNIPGGYGLPFLGPIKDRYDYFYNQGEEEFFRTRITKYKSTVFRTNMPPGPFISSNSKVIALLDSNSFPILFDTSKVQKRDIFVGTYMPSTAFYGGYRVCAFLDPSEANHHTLKSFILKFLASIHNNLIPYLQTSLSELFSSLEDEITDGKPADFNHHNDIKAFDFVLRLVAGVNPSETKLKSKGPGINNTWLALQLAPLQTLGLKYLPDFIDDVLHTFRLPFFVVKPGYQKLYDVVYESATLLLDEAEKVGIKREEACHNLVFVAGFNTFGGLKVLLPGLIKWVGSAGESLHRRLAEEIRSVVKEEGGVTFSALEKMSLTKSVAYEALRMEPPVPYQYATAKEDMVVESHDAAFEIKKGETIFGFQPLATKDPKVFDNPEVFVADRFMGEGEKLLKYVYWSNGRETDTPTADNKQCPAKDMVVMCSRIMVVELFLRYDTFTVDVGKVGLGSSVKITSLTKPQKHLQKKLKKEDNDIRKS